MPSDNTHSYAIFSALYSPHVGGVESFTANLAKKLVEQGNAVVVVTSMLGNASEREHQADGVEVMRLASWNLMGGRLPIARQRTGAHRNKIEELKHKDIDRVLVNTRFYTHSLVGLDFARDISAPAVVLDHGSAYLTLGNTQADALIRRYEHMMSKKVKAYHPIFAGISHMSAQWLKTFGIHTERVIPNAIDAARFREASSGRDFRQELGIEHDVAIVSFVGRLAKEKGPDKLVDAAHLTAEKFVYVCAGDGPMRPQLEKNADANVHFVGSLSHADLSALLSQSQLFCLPTRSEGFCTALLEAAAWGVTPVMPCVGGTQEIMGQDGRRGILLPDLSAQTIAQGLDRALEKNDGAAELRHHVEQCCSWEASVAQLEQAFA